MSKTVSARPPVFLTTGTCNNHLIQMRSSPYGSLPWEPVLCTHRTQEYYHPKKKKKKHRIYANNHKIYCSKHVSKIIALLCLTRDVNLFFWSSTNHWIITVLISDCFSKVCQLHMSTKRVFKIELYILLLWMITRN